MSGIKARLQLFARPYPRSAVDELKPFHVQQWIDSYRSCVRLQAELRPDHCSNDGLGRGTRTY